MNEFLRSVLEGINSVINNYGWSIMVFTFLVRFVLLPFDAKSRKSMRKMSLVQPKISELQKKYANDKEKLNQKTAELYKKEKINPLSSCLPMILTLPVLFAMFAAMRMIANAQLASQLIDLISGKEPQYERFLWIRNIWMPDSPFASIVPDEAAIRTIPNDIWKQVFDKLTPENFNLLPDIAIPYDFSSDNSIKLVVDAMITHMKNMDTYLMNVETVKGFTNINLIVFKITVYIKYNGFFILPILAAGTQILMTKLNPAATGVQQTQPGAQGKMGGTGGFMKWFFPAFSLLICSSQNAGFSLYWVAANIIMSIQTWVLNQYFDAKDKKQTVIAEGTLQ